MTILTFVVCYAQDTTYNRYENYEYLINFQNLDMFLVLCIVAIGLVFRNCQNTLFGNILDLDVFKESIFSNCSTTHF